MLGHESFLTYFLACLLIFPFFGAMDLIAADFFTRIQDWCPCFCKTLVSICLTVLGWQRSKVVVMRKE